MYILGDQVKLYKWKVCMCIECVCVLSVCVYWVCVCIVYFACVCMFWWSADVWGRSAVYAIRVSHYHQYLCCSPPHGNNCSVCILHGCCVLRHCGCFDSNCVCQVINNLCYCVETLFAMSTCIYVRTHPHPRTHPRTRTPTHTHTHTPHTYTHTDNPVAIATTSTLSLNAGSQGTFIPALVAFVSGSPQPSQQQITWTKNGAPSTTTGHLFPLSTFITSDHAGVYVCSVNTALGTALAEFTVNVNGRY